MDILISVFAKVAEYLVQPAKRCACLMFDSQAIVGKLHKDYEQLQCIYNQLNSDCEEAVRRDGEKIEESVNQWSKEAKAMLAELQNWLDSAKAESTICRHCPRNWGRNYRHSREATRKRAQIHQLLTRRQTFSTLTRPASPKGIEILQQEKLPKLSSVDRTLKKIMEALEKRETNMVGVCGMGGIGKTTLVKEVGFKAKREGLFNMVVMAVVSQSAEIQRIQRQLGEQLGLRYSSCETEYGKANQLRARIKLEGKILVILDDVWSKIKLTEIGIPHGNDHDGCCKVLLSTRREQVCTSMECQEIIHIELLEDKGAWDLFKQNVGPILNDMSPEMEKVAKGVCRECDRLPLALVVVGRALRDKNLAEWQCAAEKLRRSRLEEIETVDHEENVYERIKLSYDFLKGEVTKKCFLLCSLFPEDHEIEMGELALYATGFGWFDEYESAIHQVESTINDLIESSLLMRDNGRSRNVRMHDMVRDAALWMTAKGEDKFLVPIPSQRNWTRNQKFDNVAAISLLACLDNQHFPHVACPRLKILALAQRVPLHLRDNCFEGMQALCVLDLTAKRPLALVLPTSLQHLNSLRTLLLRRWMLSGDISIIGSLSNLEILSLSGCAIAELPMALVKLSELRFLDLSGCKDLSKSYTEVVAQLMKQELRVIHGPNVQMKALEDNE